MKSKNDSYFWGEKLSVEKHKGTIYALNFSFSLDLTFKPCKYFT